MIYSPYHRKRADRTSLNAAFPEVKAIVCHFAEQGWKNTILDEQVNLQPSEDFLTMANSGALYGAIGFVNFC